MEDFDALNLRKSHPNLYRGITTFAIINIALGLNFFYANPTFNPYQIDKTIVGLVFLILGMSKLIFLNVHRSLKIVRFLMAAEIIFMVFWGIGSTITFFTGHTSLQLFVLYIGLAVQEIFLLLEPPANPMTGESPANPMTGQKE